jgi:hypothetical protein
MLHTRAMIEDAAYLPTVDGQRYISLRLWFIADVGR